MLVAGCGFLPISHMSTTGTGPLEAPKPAPVDSAFGDCGEAGDQPDYALNRLKNRIDGGTYLPGLENHRGTSVATPRGVPVSEPVDRRRATNSSSRNSKVQRSRWTATSIHSSSKSPSPELLRPRGSEEGLPRVADRHAPRRDSTSGGHRADAARPRLASWLDRRASHRTGRSASAHSSPRLADARSNAS